MAADAHYEVATGRRKNFSVVLLTFPHINPLLWSVHYIHHTFIFSQITPTQEDKGNKDYKEMSRQDSVASMYS